MSSKLSQGKKTNTNSIKKSDVDFYKMSSMFFILCAMVLLIMRVSTTLAQRHASGLNMAYELYKLFRHPVYIAVVSLLLVASAVWVVVSKVKKTDESLRVLSSVNALALMLYVAYFSAYFGVKIVNNASDCMFILAVTVVLALLYYVSKIYHQDFLLFSLENALLAGLLYKYWHVYTARGIAGKVLLVIVFAAVGIVASWYIKKNCTKHPSQRIKQRSLLFFPYYISLAFWTVFMFIKISDVTGEAPLSINSTTMLTVMLAQYIVFAIVYTIKLIRE